MKRKIVLAMFCVFFTAITILPLSISAAEKELKLAAWGPTSHPVFIQRQAWIKDVNTALFLLE